jgi:hypothetical protein
MQFWTSVGRVLLILFKKTRKAKATTEMLNAHERKT